MLEYNTNRPHQSLDMQCPADRFAPRPADADLPLTLAVEITRTVPVSGNLTVCGQRSGSGPRTTDGVSWTLNNGQASGQLAVDATTGTATRRRHQRAAEEWGEAWLRWKGF